MGVLGLATAIYVKSNYCKSHAISRCQLIIDGNNLIGSVHRQCDLNGVYGGEYDALRENLEKFFSALQRCGIKPVFVFDGFLHKRLTRSASSFVHENKMKSALQALEQGQSNDILPLFGDKVLQCTARKWNFEMHQCYSDSNRLAVSLANERGCPVLSRNSDFFIMEIENGFIYYDSLEWNDATSAQSRKTLRCKIFYFDSFMRDFPSLHRSVIPLFAVIFGKDFLSCEEFRKLMNDVVRRYSSNEPSHYIRNRALRIFNYHLKQQLIWLFNKTRQSAINEIKRELATLDKGLLLCQKCGMLFTSRTVNEFLQKSMNFYERPKGDEKAEDEALSFDVNMPDWCREAFSRFHFSPFLVELLAGRSVTLFVLVEHFRNPSVFECAAWIRKIVYTICLKQDASSGHAIFVIEHIRDSSTHITERQVKLLSEDFVNVPDLNLFGTMPLKAKKSHFYQMLNVKSDVASYIENLAPALRGFALSLKLWYESCGTTVKTHIFCLIACSFMLLTKQDYVTWWRKSKFFVSDIDSKKAFLEAMRQFEKSSCDPEESVARKFSIDSKIVHRFNQWHAIVQAIDWLHSVTGRPFCTGSAFDLPLIRVEQFFCGSICYSLAANGLCEPRSEGEYEFLSNVCDKPSPIFSSYCAYESCLRSLLFQ